MLPETQQRLDNSADHWVESAWAQADTELFEKPQPEGSAYGSRIGLLERADATAGDYASRFDGRSVAHPNLPEPRQQGRSSFLPLDRLNNAGSGESE